MKSSDVERAMQAYVRCAIAQKLGKDARTVGIDPDCMSAALESHMRSIIEKGACLWQVRHKWPSTGEWSMWLDAENEASAKARCASHRSFSVEAEYRALYTLTEAQSA